MSGYGSYAIKMVKYGFSLSILCKNIHKNRNANT